MTVPALRADGLLRVFSEAGVLAAADVQVAARLGALTGEHDDRVLLAAALTVRGTRLGSMTLDLAEVAESVSADPADAGNASTEAGKTPLPWPDRPAWEQACAASPLTRPGEGDGCPLRQVGTRLWLDRYWRQEAFVAEELLRRAQSADDGSGATDAVLAELFGPDDGDQRAAAAGAIAARISVIAGGPGTGKTTTIARLVATVCRLQPSTRVALAAPTGKAAVRMEQAVRTAGPPLSEADRHRLAGLRAMTLHRLLGRLPGRASRFRHNRDNRLPFDLVIVDEASMVSLTLMARLLEALPPSTRLVLVGDPDQLASVEAGAVLGDVVEAGPALPGVVQRLGTTWRFQGHIAALAELVRAGDAEASLRLLAEQPAGLEFYPIEDGGPLTGAAQDRLRRVVAQERQIIAAAEAGDDRAALAGLDRHRLLCAHRSGPRGVQHWSTLAQRWLAAAEGDPAGRRETHYVGQPLLMTENDYENELYNGDTGVVIERAGQLLGLFGRGAAPITVPLSRLTGVRPLHAMTVHRAQGSQFDEVTVLLPLPDSPLATRQTFYTAITRASRLVRVIGSPAAVLACVNRPAARATALRERLERRLTAESWSG